MNQLFSLFLVMMVSQSLSAFDGRHIKRNFEQKQIKIKSTGIENERIKNHRQRIQLFIAANKPKLAVDE